MIHFQREQYYEQGMNTLNEHIENGVSPVNSILE